jgi:AmmeMemoRadiSam system protein A
MPVFSSSEHAPLLRFVRQTIQNRLERQPLPPLPALKGLQRKLGCFVTLHRQGMLRGCIGTFDNQQTLGTNLARMAPAAAFEDPRFPSVAAPELNEIKIEVSILSEMKKAASPGEVEIGRHGIYVQYAGRGGTYLPEVAVEQGWSRDEFIRHCACDKAGLSPEEVAQADLYLYEVEKISEAGKVS